MSVQWKTSAFRSSNGPIIAAEMPTQRKGKVLDGFEVLFLKPPGKCVRRCFKSEDELVDYLKRTKETEAPISFRYADGTIVDRATLDHIHRRFFNGEP